MNTIDYLKTLKPEENRLFEILKIDRPGLNLSVILGCSDGKSTPMCLSFYGVLSFEHTLVGAPDDSEQLPQTLVGLDYWLEIDDQDRIYRWELNGDECTWNFRAPFPTIDLGFLSAAT